MIELTAAGAVLFGAQVIRLTYATRVHLIAAEGGLLVNVDPLFVFMVIDQQLVK